jgi:hypothetical protein
MQNIDKHNADVLTRALQKRGGRCQVCSIPVICSDDEILIQALRRMGNITARPTHATHIVALKR